MNCAILCFRWETIDLILGMASQPLDVRLLLSEELKEIRSKIVEGKLVLFVGEKVSTLVSSENTHPSLDDWWKIVDHAEVGRRRDSANVDIGLMIGH